MSRHTPSDPSSRMEVLVRARPHNDDIDVADATETLFAVCLLEARSRHTDRDVRRVDERTWSFRIRPALDESDQRQLRGCLEDARIDRYQADVVEMRLL